jgi:formate--tetrahydrofolate ligase
MHGGGPPVKPGTTLDPAYSTEDLGLLEKGCDNLIAHIDTVLRSGVRPVVCINAFTSDTPAEQDLIRRIATEHGAKVAVSDHWGRGGEGAIELAEAVMEACEEPQEFTFLYDRSLPLRDRIEVIATDIYGADGVTYAEEANEAMARIETDPQLAALDVCMVKTHLSLSHDPNLKGRPTGWTLPVRDVLIYQGAGLAVPVTGSIKLMPGTASNPAFRRIDVDVETGRVQGLF